MVLAGQQRMTKMLQTYSYLADGNDNNRQESMGKERRLRGQRKRKSKIQLLVHEHAKRKREAWDAQVSRPKTLASQCMIAAINMAMNQKIEAITAEEVQESIERQREEDSETAKKRIAEKQEGWTKEDLSKLEWWTNPEQTAVNRHGGRKNWNMKENCWDGAYLPSDIATWCGREGSRCNFDWRKCNLNGSVLMPLTDESRREMAGRRFVLIGTAHKSTDKLSKKKTDMLKAGHFARKAMKEYRNNRCLHAVALRFDEEGFGWLLDTNRKAAAGCTAITLTGFLSELLEVYEVEERGKVNRAPPAAVSMEKEE